MTQYIARRVLQTIPLLLGVSIVVFLGMHVIPGDAASAMAGQGVTPRRSRTPGMSYTSTSRCRSSTGIS